MKKLFPFLYTCLLMAACSEPYDDSALSRRISELEKKTEALENRCREMNSDISSLQKVVSSLNDRDYITSVESVIEEGRETGYKILFESGEEIRINHGKDGAPGQNGQPGKDDETPVLGVAKDDDGIYYWTLDGEWMITPEGGKLPATGDSGVTPKLKIEGEYWKVSYDGGESWEELGLATAEASQNSVFKGIDNSDEEAVVFILHDDSRITVPRIMPLDLLIETENVIIGADMTVEINYSIRCSPSQEEDIFIEVLSSEDVKARIETEGALEGKIVLKTTTEPDEYSKAVVFVTDGSKVIARTIRFEAAGMSVVNSAQKQVGAAGGTVILEFLSNVEYSIQIGADVDWITAVGSKAMMQHSEIIQILPNTGITRQADVHIVSPSGLKLTYTIVQDAASGQEMSIADVLNSAKGTHINAVSGVVVASDERILIISDGTDNLFVYYGDFPMDMANAKVGDRVLVSGTVRENSSVVGLSSPTTTVISSGNAIDRGDAMQIDASNVESLNNLTTATYISVTGSYMPDYGNAFNMENSVIMPYMPFPTEEMSSGLRLNFPYTINGYFIGFDDNDIYFAIIPTEITPHELYTSADYSQDGKMTTLQNAKVGNGIDIVLMGDGYSDRMIADGTYREVMEKAAGYLFSKEPYATFKDYFNIYMVNVVSANEVIGADTALSTEFGEGTSISGDYNRCFEYALKATPYEKMDEATIVVMQNSLRYAGTCWWWSASVATDYASGLSISYFPTGTSDSDFEALLHHETLGHGFGKLADEYAYEYNGALPAAERDNITSMQSLYGWYMNVDITNDLNTIKWSKYINDSQYANEGLGAFEGAFTYFSGVWRPTENSIMRYNTGQFNAPSRETIYKRIHKLAFGADWQYDHNDFVEYDAINRAASGNAANRASRLARPVDFKPTHPPVVVPHAWNE